MNQNALFNKRIDLGSVLDEIINLNSFNSLLFLSVTEE